jgi:hypothetical protein
MLGQWDREKGVPVDDTKLTLARKETIMQEIAIALHRGRIGAQYGRKEASRQEIVLIVSGLLQKFDLQDGDADSLFEKLVGRSGLIMAIERYSERYAFSHLTFQEYYAAAYLFTNQLDPFEATNITAGEASFGMTNWWSEVFALYGAMKRQSSDIIARLMVAPSEDNFGRRLRLAAQCMLESIEVNRDVADQVLNELFQVRFGIQALPALLPRLRRYLLRFAAQPQFFGKYIEWKCDSARSADEATELLELLCGAAKVGDTAIQSAALRGTLRIWKKWGIGSQALNEVIPVALKSPVVDIQLSGIELSIELHTAGALTQGSGSLAFETFLSVADMVEPRLEASEDGRRRMIFRLLIPQRLFGRLVSLAPAVARLIQPMDRDDARDKLWKVVTAAAPVPVEMSVGQVKHGRTVSRQIASRCLAVLCLPSELAEIRSDLNRGLELGTGAEQAALLPLLYDMFRSEESTLDELISRLMSPFTEVRQSALQCLLVDPPRESRARIREAIRGILLKRRSRGTVAILLRGLRPANFDARTASIGPDDELAMRWIFAHALQTGDSWEDPPIWPLEFTNGEIGLILKADAGTVPRILGRKAVLMASASSLSVAEVQYVTTCYPILTRREKQQVAAAIKRACRTLDDGAAFGECIARAGHLNPPLKLDDEFREALLSAVDHKSWTIADAAAELLTAHR